MALRAFITSRITRTEHPEAGGSPYDYLFDPGNQVMGSSLAKTIAEPEFVAALGARLKKARLHFGVGAAGSGTPEHIHPAAWNALAFGRKLWQLR